MTQISAIRPAFAPAAPVEAAVATPKTQAPVETAKTETAYAPIALAANGTSRVIMDAANAYECGTQVETAREKAAPREFDRLAYVIEGLEHMRRMMQASAEMPVEGMAAQPAQGAGMALDMTV